MPPRDPLQRADADAATQPLLLGAALNDLTDGASYADTSGHPADEKPAGEENAEQDHHSPSPAAPRPSAFSRSRLGYRG